MVDLNDTTINARARAANALAAFFEVDPRVRRWRRVEFADDGGAVVVLELMPTHGRITAQVIARELEFTAARELPGLPWIRVQVA
jgi:hypothetical protein